MGCFHGDIPNFLNFPTESFIVPIADLSASVGFPHPRISSNAVRAPKDAPAGGPYYVYNADAHPYIILSSLPAS
jgi:hypothetical protein